MGPAGYAAVSLRLRSFSCGLAATAHADGLPHSAPDNWGLDTGNVRFAPGPAKDVRHRSRARWAARNPRIPP
jgi:hypothetical protein